MQALQKAKSGLYLHIPFCRSKCHYCDFYSISSLAPLQKFLEGLKKEIFLQKDTSFQTFDTVYIGGGTPSFLKEEHIELILKAIFERFQIEDRAEITIEANPCDIDISKAKFLKEIGINRITLGIQSLRDDILKFLGRSHSAAQALKAYENLRKAGFENIGIDMIYGIPGQSIKEWLNDLKQITLLNPEHISCYELTFEKKTYLWKLLSLGKIVPMSEDKKADFFMQTSAFLESKGYIHYEISNFAKSNLYVSKHNLKYWMHIPYLGLGPSAHSFDGKKRWWNFASIKRYYEKLKSAALPIEGTEQLSEEQLRIEKIFLGLRTCYGVEISLCSIKQDVISFLEKEGLIRTTEKRIIPTKKGFLLADQLANYLI